VKFLHCDAEMHAGSRQTGQLAPLTKTVSGRRVLDFEFEGERTETFEIRRLVDSNPRDTNENVNMKETNSKLQAFHFLQPNEVVGRRASPAP
jgi:hypothetical protein